MGVLTSCAAPKAGASQVMREPTGTPTTAARINTPAAATLRPTPQSTATLTWYGPDTTHFPAGFNPMTGLPAIDTPLLDMPAVLVSISHFPASGRPQAGLSFAPFVYEFSITGGESRFLAAFYGQLPKPEVPVQGNCEVRVGLFESSGTVIGNRVWLDENANGRQDVGEGGVPGICVSLHNNVGKIVDTTTTDTNGMYGFNVVPGGSYSLDFERPDDLSFTGADAGNEESDSDADPLTGRTGVIAVHQGVLDVDAGLVLKNGASATSLRPIEMPEAEVGPVRSGRLLYADIGESYTNSCLIYAFASPEILPRLPRCAFVAHEEAGGGDMLSLERMQAVAEDNMRHTAERPFDYSSNLYSQLPSPGGIPALQLDVIFGNINHSGWFYDPLYQGYLRYVDDADINARDVLHPEVDRLTGRQLHFENVVVMMAETDVISATNLDIHLEGGNDGPARLFRNGQVFSITWSTQGDEYEDQTGLRRPIRFLNPDGSPAALSPGSTWVIIVTPFSAFEPQGGGKYMVRYAPPAGEDQ